MKLKIISGIMLITLSSLGTGQAVAASSSTAAPPAVALTADGGSAQQPEPARWNKAKKKDTQAALRPAPKYPQPYAGQAAAQLNRSAQQAAVSQAAPLSSTVAPVAAAPSANSAAPSATAAAPLLTLRLQENHLLSQDVSSWAKAQGMHPLWNSNRDYLIYSTINLIGKDHDDVLNQLGQLFRSENYGLVVKLYEKNHVLVIDNQ